MEQHLLTSQAYIQCADSRQFALVNLVEMLYVFVLIPPSSDEVLPLSLDALYERRVCLTYVAALFYQC